MNYCIEEAQALIRRLARQLARAPQARTERVLSRAHARLARRCQSARQPLPCPIRLLPDTVLDWCMEACPYCGEYRLVIEIDEWDAETGIPTETGVHVTCRNEGRGDLRDHYDMPYVYWLPIQRRAARWVQRYVQIGESIALRLAALAAEEGA